MKIFIDYTTIEYYVEGMIRTDSSLWLREPIYVKKSTSHIKPNLIYPSKTEIVKFVITHIVAYAENPTKNGLYELQLMCEDNSTTTLIINSQMLAEFKLKWKGGKSVIDISSTLSVQERKAIEDVLKLAPWYQRRIDE